MTPNHRDVDATSLAGLAHPLRVQLLDQLVLHGPATATLLAARLHESSGATSYHLRQLERYGFVEEDPDRGSGRERWWRRVAGGVWMNTPELNEQPGLREATKLVVNEFHRGRNIRGEQWLNTYQRWPRMWQDGSSEGTNILLLTAAEMGELSEAIVELLVSWRGKLPERDHSGPAGGEYRHVEVQHSVFPLADPDATDNDGIPTT